MSQIAFTVYCKAEPQGSIKAFTLPGGKVRLTSDNKKMKPYRHVLTQIAREEMSRVGLAEPMAGKHVPVEMALEFVFVKPASCGKKRLWPVVKPDIDKLERATLDSLTGVLFADDAQVVMVHKTKIYGPVEQVKISARTVEAATLF